MTTGPYLVTVNRYSVNRYLDDPTAVATLDEARLEAGRAVDAAYGPAPIMDPDKADVKLTHLGDAENVPESGGTVGPLPDGTVIEVERKTWRDLDPYCRFDPDAEIGDEPISPPPDEIIAAANEAWS